MQTKTIKTLSVINLQIIYCLMILSMLLANIGIKPVSAGIFHTISGNAGVAGATLTYSGGSETADGSGNYTITLWHGSSVTVTPSKAGYSFSPASRSYSNITVNQTNQNYTATAATYTISGSAGTAGAGATVTYTGGSTTADSTTGNYSFTVSGGWSGTVTPSKTGYTFTPANRSYSNIASNQTNQNYTAAAITPTISGNAGTGGATLSYTDGAPKTVTANSSGVYSFQVSNNWSGTVTPSKTGFSFVPGNRAYANVVANQTAQDYTARPTVFSFASMGDASAEAAYFSTTVNQISTLNPALVLFNGDMENTGFILSEMNPMIGALKTANLFNKTFLVRGNADDHVSGSAALWENYFETAPNIKVLPAYVTNKVAIDSSSDQLTYSFNYGNSIFIGVDVPGDINYMTTAQMNFIDARLTYAESQGLTHAFIFFHGPEYPVESVHSTCSTRADANCTPPALITIINNHPIVSATLHGHEQVLSWTHMDNTRVAGLTRSYEQFITSPAGGTTYNEYLFPERVDYAYPDIGNSQGFATISVDGLSFTYNIYKVGTAEPVWSHTFSKLNTAPTISDITDKTTNEDIATGSLSFTVGDVETAVDYLSITASSSNTALVPNGNISLGGSGANRTINITPASNQSGAATITVSVNDGTTTVSDTFLLTVNAVNDAPIANAQSVSLSWNSFIDLTLTGSDVEGSPLTYNIVDNPAHGSLTGSDANWAYTPTPNYSGSDSFTFTSNDGIVDSAAATVSINVTAHTISGNAGVTGATLSYSIGATLKTVTADAAGLYSFQVPADWSGTVTPAKDGYIFSPTSMTYANVLTDQTAQNYTTTGVTFTISGNAGVAGATLSYTDGTPKTVTSDEAGLYTFEVPYNWSGTVTPSKTGYGFKPGSRTYTNLTSNQFAQDYITTTSRVWYVDKTNPACTDTGQVGSFAVPFCTIGRGAYLATAGQIVHVLHGTYAESVFPNNTGTAGNPITFWGDPGVTVTGTAPGIGFGSAFGVTTKSYIVIDGFTITNTWYKGIYVDASDHITLSNNHVSNAGITSLTHPYEQGIYMRNTTYSTITGNTTDHNTCIGIRVVTGGHNLISNNKSYENFSVVESDAAGIELTGSSYNTIINNITYSNEDSGINVYLFDSTVDVQSTYNLVIGNLTYENGDHGIDDNNSPYNTFIGNTVQGNGTTGINVEGETATGSHHATVINNIISGNGFTPPVGSFPGNLRVDVASVDGTVIDYNLFNKESAMYQIIWNGVNYASLAAFHAVVPTQEAHGLEGDPLFVDPVPSVLRQTGVNYVGLGIFGNYYPKPGSPAIDSANSDAPNQPASDIDGNTRVDDPATPDTGAGTRTYDDCGAYEFLPLGQSLPIVTTQAVTSITTTTATGNGNITATGEPNPTQHGVVWNTTGTPTTADNKTEDGAASATGAFISSMTGLTPGTLYYVRAYATNTMGTVYGDEVTFTSLITPTVTTQAVTKITTTTATGNGNITALGVPNPTQYGVVWGTSANPTLADNKTTDGSVSVTGAFSSEITGLTPGTLYHVRAYATNEAGTSYGDDVTFTAYQLPLVTTSAVTSITTTTATGNGNVTALGVPNPSQHGVVWSTSADPTIADSKTTDGAVSEIGAFSSSMTDLIPGTLYHIRAYAANSAGVVYGEDLTFTTLLAPSVTTQAVTDITTTTAIGNGNITVLGTYNPTEHGVVWGTSPNPTVADNKTTEGPVSAIGAFTSAITGLTPGTLYHVRAYATSAAGTSYGEDVTFTAHIVPTVTTQAVSSIGTTTAVGNGTVAVLGVPNPTQHGVVWSASPNPTISDNKTMDGDVMMTGAFTSSITGLTPGMLYHVRAYATNDAGTSYGEDVSFTTLPSTTGTTIPATNAGTGANVTVSGSADWANPGYIVADDTSYASATLSGGTLTSGYLEGANYGFAIPADAAINGIMVTIGRYESGIRPDYLDVRDSTVKLLKAGLMTGSNKAAAGTEWPTTSPVAAIYGTPADLWGTTWTPAEINASNFGVALSVISGVNRIAYVDYMQISVTYTVTMVGSNTTVSCGAGTPVVTYGSNITCVATVVRGSGSKTPTGNVSWITNGSGNFVTSPCILSGSAGTSTCSVTYMPNSVGSDSHLITATYAGDPNFFTSNGNQTVTVNKKSITITPTEGQSKVYGAANPTFTYTPSPALESGDSFSGALDRASGENVGDYAYTLGTLSAGTNYTLTLASGHTFAITAKPITITPDDGQSKVYGEVDPTFAYVSSPSLESGDSFTGTLERASGEDVSDYAYALGTLSAGANYTLSLASGHAFAVTAKPITITPDDGQSKVYGEVNPTFAYVPSSSLESGDSFSGALDRASGENVGDYAYTLGTLSAGTNYTLSLASGHTFAITAKRITITPDDAQSKIYSADDPIFTYTPAPSLESGDSFTGALERTSGEDVGDYAYTLGTLNAGSNYTLTLASGHTFAITAKPITITPDDGQSKVYGEVDPTFAYVPSPSLESGDSFIGALERAAGSNVGDYAYTLGTLNAGTNYTLTLASGHTFAITAKPITITPNDGQNKVYSADDPTYTYTHTALEGTDSITGALDRASGEDVGEYAFTIGTLSAGANYTLSLASSHTFAITAKPITITPDDGQSKVYGEVDPTFAYVPSPSLESGDSFTGALDRASGEDVNDYAFTLGTLSAGTNYTLSLASGHTFAVTAKPITITPNDGQSKSYGEVDPTFTYTHTALEGTDTITGALDRESGENVGDYAYALGTLSAGSNYTLSLASGHTFAVTAKPITITPNNGQNKIYGEVDPTFAYIHTALEGTDTITGVLERVSGEDVGDYAYTLGTLSAGTNYTLSLASGHTFAITQSAAAVTLSNLNQTYDGTPKSVTVTTVPDGLTFDITYDGSPNPPTAVGNYEVVATVTDPNYTGTANGTLVIIQTTSTHSIPLVAGWNLISFKVHPENTETTAVLSSIDGNYDLVYAWDATNTSDKWLMYDPAMPFGNTLDHLDETMGFWIHMVVADTLDVVGDIPATTNITLHTGWNLVGYPSEATRPLPEALSDNGAGADFSLVYAYHANDISQWKMYDPSMPFGNDLTDLSPGWGYWIWVNEDCTWSVMYLAE